MDGKLLCRAVEKRGGGGGVRKIGKSENIKFSHDFSLFIEKDISDKKEIVFLKFVAVNLATTVNNKEVLSFCF